ncbi:MAG TPA: DUF4388 domain-containing protein [Vicinamibacteria bacterium]|nr:DUF4388 domain-containing protein [Vicinamibacteria bacterium]
MALSGTLKDFALPDIFQLIGMQRKTGLLTLENERETVSVVFEQGMVVHADSTVRRLDDLLGNVLVRQRTLRRDALEDALAKQKVSMQRLGFILTNQGYISRDDLKAALSEQVQQIVFRVFRWKSGRYHFDPAAGADYDRENMSPVSTDHILMEGIRRVDEWPIIEKRIPSLDFVFRPLVPKDQIRIEESSTEEAGGLEASLDLLSGKGGGTATLISEVVLSPLEGTIYKLLDGKRSVAAVMELTGLSDFDVCRALFDFVDRKLVVAAGQEQAKSVSPGLPHADVPAQGETAGKIALVAVLVLAASGFLISLGEPFRVPPRPSFMREEAATIARSRDVARMQRVVAALRSYYLTFGVYPGSLDDLVNTTPPLVAPEDLTDASGQSFRYETQADRVTLQALGPSGSPYLSISREILPDDVSFAPTPSVRSSSR